MALTGVFNICAAGQLFQTLKAIASSIGSTGSCSMQLTNRGGRWQGRFDLVDDTVQDVLPRVLPRERKVQSTTVKWVDVHKGLK